MFSTFAILSSQFSVNAWDEITFLYEELSGLSEMEFIWEFIGIVSQ